MIKALEGGTRVQRSRFMLLVALGGAFAGMAVALVSLRMADGLLAVALALLGLLLSVASLLAGKRWWGEADEAVREAHKAGWYWGGSGGLGLAGGLLAAMFSLKPDTSLRPFALFPGDAGLVATGLALAIALAFLGYLVGWAGWWLIRGR